MKKVKQHRYLSNQLLLNKFYRVIIGSLLMLIILSCGSRQPIKNTKPVVVDAAPDETLIDWSKIKPAIPKREPISRYGNPVSYEQDGITYTLLESATDYKKQGIASWYGTKFHGRRTSSGETYDMLKMTAAHKTLPIPVYATVTNLENGKKVVVKINDRGPFKSGRIIDLSYAAAYKLGISEKGTARVEVETITFSNENTVGSHKNHKTNPSNTNRYIQVGAYSQHKTAQNLAKVLDTEINLPVIITNLKHAGKTLYRVRIGPIATESVAQELLKILDIKELGKPQIVYQ